IRKRNISMLLQNLDILQDWANQYPNLFSFSPPKAAGMVFFQYHLDMGSLELSDYLRKNHSVFIVPGTSFGMEGFVRMGAGSTQEYLKAGLARIDEGLKELL
ncbi:MAG: aminotransferase class I/II-fold pyridoxal phosphate-dependent enzyme, partial [Bacteroidota bacterium]